MGKHKITKDFQKVKLRAGRKLTKSSYTNTSFKAKKITLPKNRSYLENEEEASETFHGPIKVDIQTLMKQLQPTYNPSGRVTALIKLQKLLSQEPFLIVSHLHNLINTMVGLFVEEQEALHRYCLSLLKIIFQKASLVHLLPLGQLVQVHLSRALNHSSPTIRYNALMVLDLILDHHPGFLLQPHLVNPFLDSFLLSACPQQAQSLQSKKPIFPFHIGSITHGDSSSSSLRPNLLRRIKQILHFLCQDINPRSASSIEKNHIFPSPKLPKTNHEKCSYLEDTDKWKYFIELLMNVLFQSTFEIIKDADGNIIANKVDSFYTILQSISHIMEIVEGFQSDSSPIKMEWFRDLFGEDFLKYFLQKFPYFSLGKSKQKDNKKKLQDPCFNANVMICTLYLHLYPTSTKSPQFQEVQNYIYTLCNDDNHFSQSLVLNVINILGYVAALSNPASRPTFKAFLRCLLVVYKNSPVGSELRYVIFSGINDIILANFFTLQHDNNIKTWLGSIPTKLVTFPAPKFASCLLTILKLPKQGFPNFLLSLQENADKLIGMLPRLALSEDENVTTERQVHLASLIAQVPHLDTMSLRRLVGVFPHVSAVAITHFLDLIYLRVQANIHNANLFEDERLLSEGIAIQDFFSLLMVCITGISMQKYGQMESAEACMQLVCPPSKKDQVAKHVSVAKAALNILDGLPHKDIIAKTVEDHIQAILSLGVAFPVHFTCTTIALATRFKCEWGTELSRLAAEALLCLVRAILFPPKTSQLPPPDPTVEEQLLLKLLDCFNDTIARGIILIFITNIQSEALSTWKVKTYLVATLEMKDKKLIQSKNTRKYLGFFFEEIKRRVPSHIHQKDWWIEVEAELVAAANR